MKHVLAILILFAALSAKAADTAPVIWTNKTTAVEWMVASYHITQFPKRNIEGKYLVLGIKKADWQNADATKKDKIKLAIHRLLTGIEELTAANVAAAKVFFDDNSIKFAVVADAFQALWDAGLRPLATEE